MWAHTTADDPSRYGDENVEKDWADRDPIERVQKYLTAKGLWDDEKSAAWDTEIAAEIQSGFDKAASVAAAGPESLYEHVLATPTASFNRQRQMCIRDSHRPFAMRYYCTRSIGSRSAQSFSTFSSP